MRSINARAFQDTAVKPPHGLSSAKNANAGALRKFISTCATYCQYYVRNQKVKRLLPLIILYQATCTVSLQSLCKIEFTISRIWPGDCNKQNVIKNLFGLHPLISLANKLYPYAGYRIWANVDVCSICRVLVLPSSC